MEHIDSWIKRAKCGNVTDINFASNNKDETLKAKRFCIGCPVISLCKTYAIAHDEYGVWGGTSRYERSRYGDFYVNSIRELYYYYGLLENRIEGVANFLLQKEHQEGQLREQSDPTYHLLPDQDSSQAL